MDRQRRVLELLIYSKMLEELRNDTEKILQTVKRVSLRSNKHRNPNEDRNPFSAAIEEANRLHGLGSEDDFATIAAGWRRYNQILGVIEDYLTDNIE
ncbi:hypothetical protein SLS59_004519 [Nothophoma quercina]|uniref:Uncharacterized protein n=1 Tax=Nothophoma quercina TaxID=749835 RepID=A0ABR3RGD0_9PLEO